MTPVAAAPRVVSLDVAELAVQVERIAGEQRLLDSSVNQSISILTTLVHDVQSEQLRARDDRHQQTLMLANLTQQSTGISRMSEQHGAIADELMKLRLQVSHWRGVVVGFGVLATLLLGGAVAWITGQFDNAATARGALESRVLQLERKP